MIKRIIVLLCLSFPAFAKVKIAAVVNGEAITSYDVAQHAKISQAMAARAKTSAGNSLESLVTAKLKIQEGAKYNITASDSDIKDALARLQKYMGIGSEDALKSWIAANGGDEAIRTQLASDIIWNKIIWQVLRGYVNVSSEEVEEAAGVAGYSYTLVAADGECGTSGVWTVHESEMEPSILRKLAKAKTGDAVDGFKLCSRQTETAAIPRDQEAKAKNEILSEKLESYSVKYFEKMRANAVVERY